MQKRSRGIRGFTLVEVLVVVGIIAILIAMLIPAVQGINEKGRIIKCSAQMKQLLASVINSATRNKNLLPSGPSGSTVDSLLATNALDGVVGGDAGIRKLTLCPGNSTGGVSYMYNPHPAVVNFASATWTNNSTLRWKTL